MTKINLTKKYPSKLLLFGEHTVLKGSQALAIPLPNFYGQWAYTADLSKQMNLAQFADYLAIQFPDFFDIDAFQEALAKGLYFESNIPTGYGVGSSGALVAAVFDTFSKDKSRVLKTDLKAFFGKMESFFHGASSGVDPLICYLEENILLEGMTKMETVELPDFSKMGDWTLFLLDTKMPRKTGPLVNLFLEKCENPRYLFSIKSSEPSIRNAIDSFIKGNWYILFELFHFISINQTLYFSEMIPDTFKDVWKAGTMGSFYKLKLCGAGGGGFILGITHDFERTKKVLKDWELKPLFQN